MKVAPFMNITLLNSDDPTSPYLSNITTGNMMKASLIFHTQESCNHFEYTRNKTTSKGVNVRCIYNKRGCTATLGLTAQKKEMIIKERTPKGVTNKFHLVNGPDIFNRENWLVNNTSLPTHHPYCLNQVPLNKRTYDKIALVKDKKKERAKYPRFGPTSACQREFRGKHTAKSIRTKVLEIESTKSEWEFDILHGVKFLQKITFTNREKQSAYYHMNKRNKYTIYQYDIEDELRYIYNTSAVFPYLKYNELFIQNTGSPNFMAFYLRSELSFLQGVSLFLDGTFSVCRN